ncbi:MAG: CopL family metal-binding regulatory protein [Thiothrix sp.]|nr:CopL family metal-binding regulatory protein [Thiothrix sp.]
MKRYWLIFILLLNLLANGMAGAGMVCAQQLKMTHAGQMTDQRRADTNSADEHAQHAAPKAPAGTGQNCDNHDQSTCDSGHTCADCLTHCASALMSALPVVAARSPVAPVATLKNRHFPSIHSSLLRPPRLS